jgi:hypothetical protein
MPIAVSQHIGVEKVSVAMSRHEILLHVNGQEEWDGDHKTQRKETRLEFNHGEATRVIIYGVF